MRDDTKNGCVADYISGGSRPSDKGGGGCHPHAGGDKGGARYQKTFFSALRASVWSKNKGGPSLDPPLTMATEIKYFSAKNAVVHTGKL